MGASIWQRWTRGARRLRQQPGWSTAAGLDWPDRIMDLPATDRHFAKQGRSIGRVVLGGDDARTVVYLKRHYQLPWWQGWLGLLAPGGSWSPAFQEWDHLAWARANGFPVPQTPAAGQFLLPGGRLQSFLAVEELTGMLPLHEAIPLASRRLAPVAFAAWKHGLVVELVRLCRRLHDRRYFHKDLYLCHFYVPEADCLTPPAGWEGRVHLIDLHRLARHGVTWPWWQAKDLGQLLYSSDVEGVTWRDRARFARVYFGGNTGLLQRLVRLIVSVRARNYHGHNRRKPQAPPKRPDDAPTQAA